MQVEEIGEWGPSVMVWVGGNCDVDAVSAIAYEIPYYGRKGAEEANAANVLLSAADYYFDVYYM